MTKVNTVSTSFTAEVFDIDSDNFDYWETIQMFPSDRHVWAASNAYKASGLYWGTRFKPVSFKPEHDCGSMRLRNTL